MAAIFDLAQERDDRTPHRSGSALCLQCKHEWIAVQPVGDSEFFACPECGCHKGVFAGPCYRGPDEMLYECVCGSQIFTLYLDGTIMCPSCGRTHEPW